jgi:hypothetical protein
MRLGSSLLLALLFFEVTEALEGPQKKVAKKLESGMRSSVISILSVSRLRSIHLKGIESA